MRTGLTTTLTLLLTLGGLNCGGLALAAPGVQAAQCPDGTVPGVSVDGEPCVVDGVPTPQPTPPTSPPPSPSPAAATAPPVTSSPTATATAAPAPPSVPASSPATIPTDIPTDTPAPAADDSSSPSTPDAVVAPPDTPTPSKSDLPADVIDGSGGSARDPEAVPPDPKNGVVSTVQRVPEDGRRLIWAVGAGASGAALAAAVVAFYLVSVRPYLLGRRRTPTS